MARHLSVDLETFSSVDIKTAGMYKYVQSPDFEILLCAFGYDNDPVQIIDLTAQGAALPPELVRDLFDPSITKHAYNAAFEWYCLSRHLGISAPEAWLSQWRCTMLHGLYLGYPAGLAAVGNAIGLPEDKQKLATGKALIRTFCAPQKRKTGTVRITGAREPAKWALFCEYCVQDVVSEREIWQRLMRISDLPAEVQSDWEIDMRINARGIALDMELVSGAQAVSDTVTDLLTAEAQRLTGLDNPNSLAQIKRWLEEQTGDAVTTLAKADVQDMLAAGTAPDNVERLLLIRQELGKSSVAKYKAMQSAVCQDGRVRGLLQFYGANRTGRWAGRLVQVQNLPRNYLEPIDTARALVKQRDADTLRFGYGNVPDTLSQLIRTAFVPSKGCKFVVADFSAIEARVIAWMAQESWRQEVFATHGKIYEASASSMFGVPIERIKKGNPEYALRQKGKIAELALGYGGSVGALVNMGAEKMGLTGDEMQDIVYRWRQANPRIVEMWHALEEAAISVVSDGRPCGTHGCIMFLTSDSATGQSFLCITLPSGRTLFFPQPSITTNRFGKPSVGYWGLSQQSKKWSQQETYGGKLTENVVQAVARDCLAVTLRRMEANGYPVVMHIHDEVVIDCPEARADLDAACKLMSQPIAWAEGLILNADGFVGRYYKKE